MQQFFFTICIDISPGKITLSVVFIMIILAECIVHVDLCTIAFSKMLSQCLEATEIQQAFIEEVHSGNDVKKVGIVLSCNCVHLVPPPHNK